MLENDYENNFENIFSNTMKTFSNEILSPICSISAYGLPSFFLNDCLMFVDGYNIQREE